MRLRCLKALETDGQRGFGGVLRGGGTALVRAFQNEVDERSLTQHDVLHCG